MSILDMFKSTPAVTPTPAIVPTQQGNIPGAPTVIADPNNPTAPVAPVADPNIPQSPLAEFESLWDTVPSDDKNAPAEPAPLTAASIEKAMANTDFSTSITADQMAAIQAGGEDATAAFAQAMNNVAKQVMVQSTLVNNKLNEQAIAKAVAQNEATLPTRLRNQASADHLKTANPMYDNPAIKPVVEATHQQLLQKYPNETNEQISARVDKFMSAMSEQFAPASLEEANATQDTDWNEFLKLG